MNAPQCMAGREAVALHKSLAAGIKHNAHTNTCKHTHTLLPLDRVSINLHSIPVIKTLLHTDRNRL